MHHHFPISIIVILLIAFPATRGVFLEVLRNVCLPVFAVLLLVWWIIPGSRPRTY